MIDPGSGVLIPQQKVGLRGPYARGEGTITYLCHTCGESIVKSWECLFVDDDWASTIVPPRVTSNTTTHHDWHLASQQRED